MLLSYNWLKEFADIDQSPEKLAETLVLIGLEVESYVDYTSKYKNFHVAEVVSREKHPNADKLSLCKVSLGGEEIQVVCGAPNVAAGQKVVFGKVGAVVPSAGFTLDRRKIRGVESFGMICSQIELELGEDGDGIWVLPEDAVPGTLLCDYLGLNDVIYELSVTPNRAACLSHYGVAREVAAFLKLDLKEISFDYKTSGSQIIEQAAVELVDSERCPRYSAILIRNVKIMESPTWLKVRLESVGLRPINAAVDVTNYVLMELGQPLHAFDFDKLADNKIVVKTASEGEKFITLDGKERNLNSEMLMICDGEKPVAIGGVMGGQNSEITNETVNILLESAYFQPSSVRRTSKKLGLMSDSSYRFERGIDYGNVVNASRRAAAMIAELCDGEIAPGIIDVYPEPIQNKIVNFRPARAVKIIGKVIANSEMQDILTRLGFQINRSDNENWVVEVPSFRHDVSAEIDIIEDVALFHGYENLEADFSSRIDFNSAPVADDLLTPPMRGRIKNYLASAGFLEIVTQNQIDPAAAKFFSDNPVKIANPLGEDLSLMRPSIIASMLKTMRDNLNHGSKNLALFEIGKTFSYTEEDENSFVAGFKEREELVIAITGASDPRQWGKQLRETDFYDAKGIFEDFCSYFRINGELKKSEENIPGLSSAKLIIELNGEKIGEVGEIKKDLLKYFEIDQKVFVVRIELAKIYNIKEKKSASAKVSQFPPVSRDLAFIVSTNIESGAIAGEIHSNGGEFLKNIELFDVYAGKNLDKDKRSLAYTLTFSSDERTLVADEVDSAVKRIVSAVQNRFGVELRSF